MIEREKVLVAYFSWSGNTHKIALQINKLVGGDLFQIKTVIDYPENYNELVTKAKKEIQTGAKPLLQQKVNNMNKYEVVFLGYPNWWNTFPAPVLSFLSESNFSDKTLIPFCTHGGGGIGQSFINITKQCTATKVLDGFSINGYSVEDKNLEVEKWLNTIDIS